MLINRNIQIRFILCSSLILFAVNLFSQVEEKQYGAVLVEAQRWSRTPGQYPWKFYETRIVDSLKQFNQTIDKQNKYGSIIQNRKKATGFFRVEKINNRWWVIDPEGYCNIQRSINTLQKGKSERNINSFNELYSSDLDWLNKTARVFKEIGINGAGAWSNDNLIREYNAKSKKHKLSYSINLNFMGKYGSKRGGTYEMHGNTGFPNQTVFVFDPEFEPFCDSLAKANITQLSNDCNLFGYFSDNELPLGKGNLMGYMNLKSENDPGKIAAENWLKTKGISKDQITEEIKNEFAGFAAERYYRISSNAIRKADPNHLYLGSRVHSEVKFTSEVMKADGKYCDVVSINYYTVWSPEKEHLENWAKWTDKPFIITEFYTKGMDSGLANTTGAGWNVRTQKARGYSYQDFCLALLESKNCVGWHYFKYQDNDPSAPNPGSSNIDSNKGIVNNDYKFYTDMTNAMKQLNKQIYSLIKYFDN